jgi:hypothetical protein
MGCDLISSVFTSPPCPLGFSRSTSPGGWDGSPRDAELLPEYLSCIRCAEESKGCKECYDLGEKVNRSSFQASCFDELGIQNPILINVNVVSTLHCYECRPIEKCVEGCCPPPPPPSPPPPPATPPDVPTDCINGGGTDGTPDTGGGFPGGGGQQD